MWETQVWSLGREDPLEKEMATHSSILAWKIPWTEEPGRLQSMGSHRVGHDWAASLSLSFTTPRGLLRWHECLKNPPECKRHRRRGFHSWVGKISLEEGAATHPGILAWRIPGTEEPGGLRSIVLQRVVHDRRNLACTHASVGSLHVGALGIFRGELRAWFPVRSLSERNPS